MDDAQASKAVLSLRAESIFGSPPGSQRINPLSMAYNLSADPEAGNKLVRAGLLPRLVALCDAQVSGALGEPLSAAEVHRLAELVRQFAKDVRYRPAMGNTSTDRGRPLQLAPLLQPLAAQAPDARTLTCWLETLAWVGGDLGRWPAGGPTGADIADPMRAAAAAGDAEAERAALAAASTLLALPGAADTFAALDDAPALVAGWFARMAATPHHGLCASLAGTLDAALASMGARAQMVDAAAVLETLLDVARRARELPDESRPGLGLAAAPKLGVPTPPAKPRADRPRSIRSAARVAESRAATTALVAMARALLRLLSESTLEVPEYEFGVLWEALCRPTFREATPFLWALARDRVVPLEPLCVVLREHNPPDEVLGAAAALLLTVDDLGELDKEMVALLAAGRLGRCPWPDAALAEGLLALLPRLVDGELSDQAQHALSAHLIAPIMAANPRGHAGQPARVAERTRAALREGREVVVPPIPGERGAAAVVPEDRPASSEEEVTQVDGVSYCPQTIAAPCVHLLVLLARERAVSVGALLHGGLGRCLLEQVLWTHGPDGEFLQAVDAMQETFAARLARGIGADLGRLRLHAELVRLFCEAVELADAAARESVVLLRGLPDALVCAAHSMATFVKVLAHEAELVEAKSRSATPLSELSEEEAESVVPPNASEIEEQLTANEALMMRAAYLVCNMASDALRGEFFSENRVDWVLETLERSFRKPTTCLHASVVASTAAAPEALEWPSTRLGNTTTRLRVVSLLLQRVEKARKNNKPGAAASAVVIGRHMALLLGRCVQHIGDAEEVPLGPGTKLVSRLCRMLTWSAELPFLVAVTHCIEQLLGVLPVGEGFSVDEALVALAEMLVANAGDAQLAMIVATVLYSAVDGVHFALQFSDGVATLSEGTFDALCRTLESGAVAVSNEALAVGLSMFSSLTGIADAPMRQRMRQMVPTMLLHLERVGEEPSADLSQQLLHLLKVLAPVEPAELEDLRQEVLARGTPAGLLSEHTRQQLVLAKYLGSSHAELPDESLVKWVEAEYLALVLEDRKRRGGVVVGP